MSLRKHHSSMLQSLKTLGKHEQWSRYMRGGSYTDAEKVGKYKIQVQEDEDDIRYFLWNPKKPCINMVISKRDKTAVLDAVEYDEDCTVDEKMLRGEGTREMIEFSLELLKRSGATKVSLSDKSTIPCHGENIALGPMYFLKYGKTWYEKYFDFHPSQRFQRMYEEAKQTRDELLDTAALSQQPCEFFDFETTTEIFRHIGFVNFHSIEWEKDL